MCVVTVSGRNVRVDGTQIGATYSSHEVAIHQGKKFHEKHYPQAKFEIIPEPAIIAPIPKKRVKKVAVVA